MFGQKLKPLQNCAKQGGRESMKLYLLRHADASLDASCDDERKLTVKGEQTLQSLCRFLKSTDVKDVKHIYHSGLMRAMQTAKGLKKGIGASAEVKLTPGLLPDDNPCQLASRVADWEDDAVLVGHNPQFTFLAAYLLTGDPDVDCIDFKRCGMVCLERVDSATHGSRPAGVWLLRWYVTPRLIG